MNVVLVEAVGGAMPMPLPAQRKDVARDGAEASLSLRGETWNVLVVAL